MGSCENALILDENAAVLGLLAHCHVPTFCHQNMMMIYLLSSEHDVTCSHLWCMRISLKISGPSKS